MGRKIPTCFCCSYVEANNISADKLTRSWWKVYCGCPWLTITPFLSDLPSSLMLFIPFLYRLYTERRGKNYNFDIKYRRGESKFARLAWKALVMVFLLQSASAKKTNEKRQMDKAIVLVLSLFDSVLMLHNRSFGAKDEHEQTENILMFCKMPAYKKHGLFYYWNFPCWKCCYNRLCVMMTDYLGPLSDCRQCF